MAVCVVPKMPTGVLEVSSTAIGSCKDYVIYTASEYASLSPQLTTSETVELAAAVMAVWAVAWGIKVLRRTL